MLERREQKSRSFVLQFIELLYVAHAQIAAGAPFAMTDIGGNPRDIDSEMDDGRIGKSNLLIGSPPGSSQVICSYGQAIMNPDLPKLVVEGENVGIQVGTGTTAPTPTDIAIETRIAHGRGATELEYGGCELIGITFSDPNGEFTIRRYFTNASGGPITVNEVGMYSIGTDKGNGIWPFLVARDKVDPGVAVADGELLRVTYVPQITV